jgi:hypothetical protein
MFNRETCVDCNVQSPETNSDHTLVSSLGWRLTRKRMPDGRMAIEWRCPVCWPAYKAREAAVKKVGGGM